MSVLGGPVVSLPTAFGPFTAQAWTDSETGTDHLAVTAARPATTPLAVPELEHIPLVRLHSECLTGDVFGSYRCDCGEQLAYALAQLQQHGGTLLYLRDHEGRGIGLANKLRAYALQESGADTVEANEQLGLPVDARDYAAAAEILHAMGLDRIRLLSNNPTKEAMLAAAGITVTAMVPTEVAARDTNRKYLTTKRDRMAHRLEHLDSPTTISEPTTPTFLGEEQ